MTRLDLIWWAAVLMVVGVLSVIVAFAVKAVFDSLWECDEE